jgi:hypothetical protein
MAVRMAKIGAGSFGHSASLAAWRCDHKFARSNAAWPRTVRPVLRSWSQ